MLDWICRYWPILVGLATSVLVAGQAIYTLGATRSDFESRDETATHARQDIREDLERHTARDSHEATSIRLERIEVQQTGIARDVGRVSEQLETLSKDVREVMRRDR